MLSFKHDVHSNIKNSRYVRWPQTAFRWNNDSMNLRMTVNLPSDDSRIFSVTEMTSDDLWPRAIIFCRRLILPAPCLNLFRLFPRRLFSISLVEILYHTVSQPFIPLPSYPCTFRLLSFFFLLLLILLFSFFFFTSLSYRVSRYDCRQKNLNDSKTAAKISSIYCTV